MKQSASVQNRSYDRWTKTDHGISLSRRQPDEHVFAISADPENLTIDLSRSALIIVDMQNDFLDSQGWFAAVRGAKTDPLRKIVTNINAVSAEFRASKAPVLHLNWGVRKDLANLPANVIDKGSACGQEIGYGAPMPNGPVLVQGSWGAQSIPEIDTAQDDLHVSKHRLSGFRDNELDQILRRLGVTTLFFTGVNLDRCVFATLMDGSFQGYDSIVIEDATTTVSPPEVSDAILFLVRLLYGFTTTTENLLAGLLPGHKTGE
ncbi:MAG: cysteine hydrolase family protein [Alphaproteobacteria bacterium]